MTTVHIDEGVTGAKRQSWKKDNPREVLKRIIEANPGASRDELKNLYRDDIRADEGLVDATIEYSFDCNYRCLRAGVPPGRRRHKPEPVAASTGFYDSKKKVKDAVIATIERCANLKLLDTILPNGKKLKDTTGAECYALGPQMGAWLVKIAGLVKRNQKVGAVLSEKEVRKIFDR